MPLTLDTGLTPSPDAAIREHQERLIALNLRTGDCWELNPMAAEIWKALGAGRTPRQAMAPLLSRFAVAPEVLERDVLSLVDQLVALGLAVPEERHPR
jgi:hypothetical protein